MHKITNQMDRKTFAFPTRPTSNVWKIIVFGCAPKNRMHARVRYCLAVFVTVCVCVCARGGKLLLAVC